ncbi:MAG: hypothetical protein ATN35_01500 [Epulopiscium sp. Nele67-Bin004]|nr:MAG: hypothetical protein ATN35_01500 [Epulopiscium sp. Nele67-Bin004]
MDVAAKKRKYSPSEEKFQNESESQFGFQPLSSTEGEAGDEERRRVGLQVGAKHQRLACASLLNYRLFH